VTIPGCPVAKISRSIVLTRACERKESGHEKWKNLTFGNYLRYHKPPNRQKSSVEPQNNSKRTFL
jgi:hypothetical protein